MAIDFEVTRKEIEVSDGSGYTFKIVLEKDPDRGWGARVTIATMGFKHEEGALLRLSQTVERLLAMLPKEGGR